MNLRKLCLLSLLMLCLCGYSSALQTPIPYQKEIDSLLQKLKTKESTEQVAEDLFELSLYYSYSDSAKAHQYLLQGKRLAKNSPYIQALGNRYEGMFFMDYDLPKSIVLLERSVEQLKPLGTPQAKLALARAYNTLSTAYQWQDNHMRMLEILMNDALPAAVASKDDVLIGTVYYKIGLNYWNNLQYELASTYLQNAITYLQKGNYDPYILNESFKLQVIALGVTGKREASNTMIENFRQFFNTHRAELPANEYHYVLSAYYRYAKQYRQARTEIDRAIQELKKNEKVNPRELASYYYQRALINFADLEFKAALADLDVNDELLINPGLGFFQDSLNISALKKRIYETLGDYKSAVFWSNQTDVLKDTLLNRRIRESILANEIKYQSLQKENEIKTLLAEKEKTASDIRNTRIIIVLIMTILILIGYFIFKNHQKNKRLLHHQEINALQKLQEEKQKQKLVSLDAMLQGEEKERNRLSRDLHDGLGSVLASIRYKVLDLQLSQPNDRVDSVLKDMDYAISEMRRISHNLMPEALRRFGLEISLEDLCKSLQNPQTKIELQLYGSFRDLSMDQQTHIYRIIQELLYNSLKHSFASNILVQASLEDHMVFITVEDNGVGFPMEILDEESKVGVGLNNVKIRVNYLHGKLDIRSEEGRGTSVDIELFV